MNHQRNQFVLNLLAYAAQRDISVQHLCQLCDIDLEALKKRSTELAKSQLHAVWKNASYLCHDPQFGLHFGESLQLAALGAVGEIVKSSETVGQAVTIACSFTPAITDLFTMEVEKLKKSFSIRLIATSTNDDFVSQQVADLLMAFTVHELNGFLLRKIIPTSIAYPYKVSNVKEYERVLRGKPLNRSGQLSIELPNSYWDEPVLTQNYELQKKFIQIVNSESREHDMLKTTSYQVKVLDYLMKNSYLGILSLEGVAANFNMTPRSLQRRLQDESVTFQQLADSVRKALALHYLESGKFPLKEISHILGYNELSAFSRAFKRWTGKAPIEFRS
jgi:AraC-like DNA-binding protein